MGGEENPPIFVYDTSGPIPTRTPKSTSAQVCPRRAATGLLNVMIPNCWTPTSDYGKQRLEDEKLRALRFDLHRTPRRAKPGQNVSQMHYARKGIMPDGVYRHRKPEPRLSGKPAATGERGAHGGDDDAPARRQFRRGTAGRNHAGICARWRADAPLFPPISTIPKANR